MKKLSPSQVVALVSAYAGARPIGIEAEVDARLLKTGNPHKNCLKYIRVTGFCGANYQNAVKREGARQGVEAENFESEKLPWGKWLVPNKVIENEGEFYLRVQTTPGMRKRSAAKVLSYRANGKFLNYEDIKPFLPEKSESKKQQRAGLDETVMVRTYKVSNLKKIRIGGQTYVVEN